MLKYGIMYFFLLTVLLTACDHNRIFEEKKDFPTRSWSSSETVEFSFDIEDPQQKYDLLCNVRSTNAYPFQNLYLQYYLEDSTGQLLSKDLNNIILYDPVTGVPRGDGLGDIYSLEKIFLGDYKFDKSGQYGIRFDHYMRADTLPEVVSLGFRIQRSDD